MIEVKEPNCEEQFQAQCIQWFWNTFPDERQMLFHVQQKAKNKIEGARFKAIGVVKGVSDLVLITYSRVIFIELKWDKGDQSKEQISFEAKVKQRNHPYFVVRSLDEFKKLILMFIN